MVSFHMFRCIAINRTQLMLHIYVDELNSGANAWIHSRNYTEAEENGCA
jgi:hypothetical protein